MDGFRSSDHDLILRCLTDDVVWYIHGHRTTHGKGEFDEIENPEFDGSPDLDVQRVFEDGNVVVVTGEGQGRHRVNGPFRFAFNSLFTFRGDRIERVDSYVVPLARPVVVVTADVGLASHLAQTSAASPRLVG
jgi:ketosteroid isomerase-like protein